MIHQKRKLLSARQDVQRQSHKALQRAGKESHQYPDPSSLEEVETLWSKIWENNKTHNNSAHWIQEQAKENRHVPTQEWSEVTTEETIKAIHKTTANGELHDAMAWLTSGSNN